MSEILRVFSPQQIFELMRNRIIADDVGITDFNEGSKIRSVLEAIATIESQTGLDYLGALRRAIPIALYDGLGFARKNATASSGYLRFFRRPVFVLEYTGSGTTCLLSINASALTTAVSGIPGDNLNLSFLTYVTIDELITAINLHGSYTATKVKSGTTASLHAYSAVEIVGETNYLNGNGRDIVLSTDTQKTIIAGAQAEINDATFSTIAAGQIEDGAATSVAIAAEADISGVAGNIAAKAIDTYNGKGSVLSSLSGVEYAINDSAYSGGQDQESNDDRAVRFSIYVQGLTGSTKQGIQAAVLAIEGIKSVTVRENYPQRGQITVVADDGTGALSSALQTEIQKVLDGDPDDLENYPGIRAAGITANVDAPIVVPVNVSIMITRQGTLSDTAEISTAVQTAIEQYVNTRKLGDDVILSEIVRVSKNAHPAVYDAVVTVPAANVSINDSSLSRTGAGTGAAVTVSINTLT